MQPLLSQTPPLQPSSAPLLPSRVHLRDLALFEASGPDALAFLQGQLTNDLLGAKAERATLAGYCTAQGRLLATMVLARAPTAQDPDRRIGLMSKDLMASVLKRLSMFVLRAKVKLTPQAQTVLGISATAEQALELGQRLGCALPDQPYQAVSTACGVWINAPTASGPLGLAAPQHRWWLALSEEPATNATNATNAMNAMNALSTLTQETSYENWQAQDIAAGLPWICAATQDLFIPQTLNLDLIDGVSFTKGCYPGQEIVARSHYRGTVKRRMHRGWVTIADTATLVAGQDIFDAQGSEQACGRIINCVATQTHAPESSRTLSLLFETTFEAVEHNALRAGARDGAPIELCNRKRN